MKRIDKHDKYIEEFKDATFKDSKHAEALKQALDVRKFEIELYWKRATYFWTFIGVAFGGYFSTLAAKDPNKNILLLVNCFGLIFSIAWYFVNRGSKFWHINWETQVDLLEDKITGPLHKSVIYNKYKFMHILKAYPFSASKINSIISIYTIAIWVILLIRMLVDCYSAYTFDIGIVSLLLTSIAIICLFFFGRTSTAYKDIKCSILVREIID